jgi:hypothetical protein
MPRIQRRPRGLYRRNKGHGPKPRLSHREKKRIISHRQGANSAVARQICRRKPPTTEPECGQGDPVPESRNGAAERNRDRRRQIARRKEENSPRACFHGVYEPEPRTPPPAPGRRSSLETVRAPRRVIARGGGDWRRIRVVSRRAALATSHHEPGRERERDG